MISLSKIKNIVARRLMAYLNSWESSYWADKPLAGSPKTSKERYRMLWEAEKANTYPDIDMLESQLNAKIDKAWLDELALHTQIVIKDSPLCYQHGRVLYAALRNYCANTNSQNLTIFETGTARGFSSVVMAKALKDSATSGKIFTFDVLPHHKQIFWNCIDDHDGKRSRATLLAPWENELEHIIFIEGDSRLNLKNIKPSRIHFAFLDGAHSNEHVLFEFSTIMQFQMAGDIIVFDDYNEADFGGLVHAVDKGCEAFGYYKNIIRLSDRDRAYVIATKK